MSDRERIVAPRIAVAPKRCGGEPTIAGTRLTTAAVASFWRAENDSIERAMKAYPYQDGHALWCAIAFEMGRRYERERMDG